MKIVDVPESWRARALVLADIALPEEWFSDDELREALQFARAARRTEWLATRVAAKELALMRGVCSDPRDCRIDRPRLMIGGASSSFFVSLSHSRGLAAAALDDVPIGIDVEALRQISESAAHLFLTDEETDAMKRCVIPNRLLHFWSAKEAAWKRGGGTIPTLKKLPLMLERESASGLVFDLVETVAIEGAVAALTTRPTS